MTSALDLLAARAARQDRAALDAVLASLRPPLLRYCRARIGRVAGSYATADDVVQDVCVALVQGLPGYREEGRPFSAWVYTIAARKVADTFRTVARLTAVRDPGPPPDRPDPGRGPEELALLADEAARVHALLRQVPARQRDVLILRVGFGMTAEETGRVVGMTPAAVRMAQSRALAHLRAIGADPDEE